MAVSEEFVLGLDPCTVVRVGRHAFHVYYDGGFGVLELVGVRSDPLARTLYRSYWNGEEINLDAFLGLWDLLDLNIKQFRSYESDRD